MRLKHFRAPETPRARDMPPDMGLTNSSIGVGAKHCRRWSDIARRQPKGVVVPNAVPEPRYCAPERSAAAPWHAMARGMVALAAAGAVLASSQPALALAPSLDGLSYEQATHRAALSPVHGQEEEEEALPNADLFTDDALQGMVK